MLERRRQSFTTSGSDVAVLPPAHGQVIRSLVGLGIDDLAKYRIVQLFRHNVSQEFDAGDCASALGLYSIQDTEQLLRELAGNGVLTTDRGRQKPYRWCTLGGLRGQLSRLLFRASLPEHRNWVINSLAARSLARAEKRAAVAKRGGRAA